MVRNWLSTLRRSLVWSCAALLAAAGVSRAQSPLPAGPDPLPAAPVAAPASAPAADDLKAQVEAQQKKIEELEKLIRSGQLRPASAEAADPKDGGAPPKPLTDADVKKIVEGYLKDNPGAGVPSGISTGLEVNKGFYIRSTPDPKWSNWTDASKIPFELRIRGRVQAVWDYYKVTDKTNHLTGAAGNITGTPGANDTPDFDQLEIKRLRLVFEGTAFDPNLRYHFELDGNTRGLATSAGGNFPGNTGLTNTGGGAVLPSGAAAATGIAPGVAGGSTIGVTDHAVRLFSAYVAYDFHPCGYEKGCGQDCPDGYYRYTPTFTALVGKVKPMISFEEYMGSANEQFVEYGMSNWFFDADDDNLMMGAGFQVKAMDDRLFIQGLVTNGNESQFPNLQMDDLKGLNIGGWYDFGGTWNDARKRYDLFGDTISDIDYSCCPVLRVGASANLVPMDRRSEFTNEELSRVRVVPGQPGGTSLIGLLNGGGIGVNAAGVGQYGVDAFDSYTYECYWAGKFKGFSMYNGWWLQNIDNFRGRRLPASGSGASVYPGNGIDQSIVYTSAFGPTLFPANKGLLTWGTQVQCGYFVIPKKLEICGRWSLISGDTGDINGNLRRGPNVILPNNITGGTATVATVPGAFTHYNQADEYAVGVNWFFYRELVKWQTDFSLYSGGNPASGGQSPAGFIPGVDGWMIRSQIQFAF